MESVVGETAVDVQHELREVEDRAARVRRRRRGVTLMGVVAVAVLAVAAVAGLQHDRDRSVATPTRSVEVKRHVGAGGEVFGPLVGSSSGNLTKAQYEGEPDFIAVFADGEGGVEPVGFVKRDEALVQTTTGAFWSDDFLNVYADDGVTVVGQFVGHHSFLTLGPSGATKMSAATLESGTQPSRAWYDQLVASCAAMQEAVIPGPGGQPPSSTARDGMVNVYDHAIGAPIQIPVAQFCSEQAALSPDPMGNLTGSFTVENGHVTATYSALNRIVENGREIAQAGGPVPFEEALRIIATQRAAPPHDY